jgi:hypothetical protein
VISRPRRTIYRSATRHISETQSDQKADGSAARILRTGTKYRLHYQQTRTFTSKPYVKFQVSAAIGCHLRSSGLYIVGRLVTGVSGQPICPVYNGPSQLQIVQVLNRASVLYLNYPTGWTVWGNNAGNGKIFVFLQNRR